MTERLRPGLALDLAQAGLTMALQDVAKCEGALVVEQARAEQIVTEARRALHSSLTKLFAAQAAVAHATINGKLP